MIKKYNTYIKENLDNLDELDYEEEEDDPKMILIGWHPAGHDWNENYYVYILKEIIDENTIIFYENYGYNNPNIKKNYTILSKEELEKYIYNNKIYIRIIESPDNDTKMYYWKDLPKEIKDLL